MKRIGLLISIFAALGNWNVSAQIKFFKTFSDNGYSYGEGLVQLQDSSFMITGSSSSFIEAPSQAFLLKVDKYGNHQWAKHFGGSESDWGVRVLSWNDSIFFITGYTNSFGNGDFDFYLAKVDKNGLLLNEKNYGHPSWERLNDALLTPDSSVVMVGSSTSETTGQNDFYIVKTDKNGDTLWTKRFGSVGNDELFAVRQLDQNTFYAVGNHYNEDSTLVKAAVLKFDDLGNIQWLKEYGSYGEYTLYDFFLRNGKLLAVGSRKHPQDGDQDEYLLRINDDGSPWLMDFQEHNSGDVYYKGVALYGDDTKTYVVSDFANEFSANSSFDVGHTRYENNLDFEWSGPHPTVIVNFPMDDHLGQIVRTSDGGWVSVGSVTSEILGGSGVYMLKIAANDNFPVVNSSFDESLVDLTTVTTDFGIKIFPNPVNDILQIVSNENETINLTFRDAQGRIISVESIQGKHQYSMYDFYEGIYFLELKKQNGETAVVKVLVQH